MPRTGLLPPGKSWYRLYMWLGGPQGRSGRVRNIRPPPPSGIRCAYRPARSESLCRLSYRGHIRNNHIYGSVFSLMMAILSRNMQLVYTQIQLCFVSFPYLSLNCGSVPMRTAEMALTQKKLREPNRCRVTAELRFCANTARSVLCSVCGRGDGTRSVPSAGPSLGSRGRLTASPYTYPHFFPGQCMWDLWWIA